MTYSYFCSLEEIAVTQNEAATLILFDVDECPPEPKSSSRFADGVVPLGVQTRLSALTRAGNASLKPNSELIETVTSIMPEKLLAEGGRLTESEFFSAAFSRRHESSAR
jgi:hypothetical protein